MLISLWKNGLYIQNTTFHYALSRHLLPEYHGELFSVVYDGLVLDEVEVVEMVGEGLQGGEDDGVAEEAGLHGVLGEPVGHQPVLTRHRRGAHRAAELPPVLRTLVLGAGLQKIFNVSYNCQNMNTKYYYLGQMF